MLILSSFENFSLYILFLFSLLFAKSELQEYNITDVHSYIVALSHSNVISLNSLEDNSLIPESSYSFKPLRSTLKHLENLIKRKGYKRILELGPGATPFSLATHVIDQFKGTEWANEGLISWSLDISYENIPVDDGFFDFVYCRHVLEDLNNPIHAFRELTRVSRNGYIETPSALIESLKLTFNRIIDTRGYIHHRFLLWTDLQTNTLYALPKYPLIDSFPNNGLYGSSLMERIGVKFAIDYEVLWNNYYFWSDDEGTTEHRPPRFKYIQHEIDYNLYNIEEYAKMVRLGVAHGLNTSQFYYFDIFQKYDEKIEDRDATIES